MRRIFVVVFLILCSLPLHASNKKGVGLADREGADRIRALNLSWYYTWSPLPISGVREEMFVPMLWGGERIDSDLRTLMSFGRIPILLTFNEPDKGDQANMSPQYAASVWGDVDRLADRISSPATAEVGGKWLDRFNNEIHSRGFKYAFLAVHLYGPPDADRFLQRLDALYLKYKTPIWITEFAVADWGASKRNCFSVDCKINRYSDEQVLRFMMKVLPELEVRPFVLRYAWFGAGRSVAAREELRTSRLFESDGRLSTLGCFYSNFHWPMNRVAPTTNCDTLRVLP